MTDFQKLWDRLLPKDQDELWDEMINDLADAINEETNRNIIAALKSGTLSPRPEEPLENLFWIERYSEFKFGVRGMGTVYSDFYKRWGEIEPHIESDHDDWPWHYFTLKPDALHVLDPWREHIHEDIWRKTLDQG